MAQTTPQQRVAQLVRLLGTPERGERANAWRVLEPAMKVAGLSWNDIGNAIDGKYTETDLQQYAQVAREEGVKAGISIGLARASNGNGGNGHMTLPEPSEMARYCNARLNQIDTKHHAFIGQMIVKTRHVNRLKPGELGFLASLYIKADGKT